MSRRLLAAVAAAALTFGLASCGEGGDGPVTTPPPEIDVGQGDGASDGGGDAPSDGGGEADDGDGSTEAAPDIPAPDPADFPGMDEQTPEGAEQAFKYFWAVVLWSHQTGDSEVLQSLYSEDCSGCKGIAADVGDLATSGTYWVGGENRTVEILADDSLEGYDIGVVYTFELTEHTEPESEGDGVVAGEEWTALGALNWNDDGWLVQDLSSSPSSETVDG